MAQHTLSPDSWTQIVTPGGNADKMVMMNLGKAEVRFLDARYPQQSAFPLSIPPESAFSLASNDPMGVAYIPAPVGMEARARGPIAVLTVGDL